MAPAPTLLWMTYWYLIMSQRRVGSAGGGMGNEWWTLYAGCAAITVIGIVLAIVGLTDREHKRGRAVLALALNLAMLVLIAVMFGLRAFAGATE